MDVQNNQSLNQLKNQLMSAYRKFKTTIYYDNYSPIQKSELAKFERNPKIYENGFGDVQEIFEELSKQIIDEDSFNILADEICSKINVIAFPKHMKDDNEKKKIIRNFHLNNNEMDRLYYFIDLPIIGHILGVLWILRCGYLLDDKLYKNCYGNRLNYHILENLKNKNSDYYIKDHCFDFSPFLFNPYYNNYQSWRDNGLESVNNLLHSKKNAIMVSMDLKEYYYRSLVDFNCLKEDIKDTRLYLDEKYNFSEKKEYYEFDIEIDNRLTNFVEKVFRSYSNKFDRKFLTKSLNGEKINVEEYPMIPIGFLPSLIISNWNLQGFDQAIIENVRPHYYGRYVDDILIVLGSHEKSESHGLQQIENNSFDELIEKYLTSNNDPAVHIFEKEIKQSKKKQDDDETIYRVYNQRFPNSKDNLINYHYDGLEIQEAKLKTYFFSHNYSNAMIENFKNEIRKNSSEFRLMHDLDSIKTDFKENLYKINYKESINKLGDINYVEINKFEISKILSRINWISSDTKDNIDDELIKNIIDAFEGKIFNYITLWEKLFTLLLINNKYNHLRDLIRYIKKSIDNLEFHPIEGNTYEYSVRNIDEDNLVKISLIKFLVKTLTRVFSLKYNSNVKDIIKDIENELGFNIKFDFHGEISNYLYSSLQNNSLMRYPLQDLSDIIKDFDEKKEPFNLIKNENNHINAFNGFCYPRFVKLHECILHEINNEIFKEDEEYNDDYIEKSFERYQYLNFKQIKNGYKKHVKNECDLNCSKDIHCPKKIYDKKQFKDVNIIKINGKRKEKLKIGLINTKLEFKDFENRILGKPNLSSKRFDKIKILINEAIKKNVDLLVMPEMYIPYEWVEKIVKISKDHQMAIIFGVEPIEYDNKIGNYIMMALPFIFNDKYKECALIYRLKNHYAPEEIRQFEKYEKKIKGEDNHIGKYYMCIWNEVHIVPYYCYEIASVDDRSIFKSCCDIVTVSEFNKDTKYFNSIAESLSRDLFCYCIKSNTSEYGGSCIIQPTSSMDKYIINLKGGEDDYIVTHDLDIKKLRANAIKSDKIADSSNFKPKPPGFWKNIVKERF